MRLLGPWLGVLIWCHSGEGEHTEVWLATGFWFVWFCGGFFGLFLVFVCFSPLVPLGQLVSVVIIFGFLCCWFLSFFFFGCLFCLFFFGLSSLVTSAPRTLCTPTAGLLALLWERDQGGSQKCRRGGIVGLHSGLDPDSGPPGPPGVCAAASLQVEEEDEDEDEEDEDQGEGGKQIPLKANVPAS